MFILGLDDQGLRPMQVFSLYIDVWKKMQKNSIKPMSMFCKIHKFFVF